MNIPQPYYNHYGGMIAFGPDGKLYIGKGDAGWEGDPLNAGQNLNVLWGKLLRIDVDTDDDTPYAVPKDNPFAKADKPQLMSLSGIREQGFTANKIGRGPRSGPMVCATPTCSTSTRNPVTCSSPMSVRTTGRRSITSRRRAVRGR